MKLDQPRVPVSFVVPLSGYEPTIAYRRSAGFTLAELAIVLLIVGLLIGGFIVPFAAQFELQRIAQTQKSMDEIKEAILGYAASQSPAHLPCPDKTTGLANGLDDTPNDGREDFAAAAGECVFQEGNIPWATLGIAPVDAWGNRFHYRVTASFANRPPMPTMTLGSTGNMQICAEAGCATPAIANNIPAVILSYGKNGYGAINASGGANAAVPASNVDERQNTDGDTTFVSRSKTETATTAGEFDDIVTWISPGVLFSRLITAQKLP